MPVTLPHAFADLARYTNLAVGDDIQRSVAADGMSESEKHAFIEAIWPRINAINA